MTSVSLNFASDNCGPAHPDIMAAVLASNDGHHMSYGADAMTQAVTAELRRIFEAPQAAVYLVATGTASNTLALSCYTKPWDAIFCHRESHVETDECGAPEFYSGGAKLSLVDGPDRKMRAANLTQAMEHSDGSVHQAQLGPISVTQATEAGTLYSCAEIEALCKIAKDRGSACHLDGARFANACVALDCTPAEMTWKAGIDAVSFG
ncbi:MAG: beta-eliminating lyase-related protein, partial [Pseudomonadota bacterium]